MSIPLLRREQVRQHAAGKGFDYGYDLTLNAAVIRRQQMFSDCSQNKHRRDRMLPCLIGAPE